MAFQIEFCKLIQKILLKRALIGWLLFFKSGREGKRKRFRGVLSIFRQARLHKLKKFVLLVASDVDRVWKGASSFLEKTQMGSFSPFASGSQKFLTRWDCQECSASLRVTPWWTSPTLDSLSGWGITNLLIRERSKRRSKKVFHK